MRWLALACALTACGAARRPPTETIEPLPPAPLATAARSARAPSRDAAPEVLYPGQVTVVHFFASWCVPCKRTIPILDWLADSRRSLVAVVGISEDVDEVKTREFVAATGARFPIRWDADRAEAALWKPRTMPTTFVVDKHGVLRFTHLGYDVQLADTLRREIEALAGEP